MGGDRPAESQLDLVDVDEQRYRRSLSLRRDDEAGARSVAEHARERRRTPVLAELPLQLGYADCVCHEPARRFAAAAPRVLVGGNVLFASDDRGVHWNAISPDLTRNEKAHQQASGGPIDEDMSGAETSDTILDVETTSLAQQMVWVGTDDGLIQLSIDMGAHWNNVTPAGMPAWSRYRHRAGPRIREDRLRFRRPASSRRRPSVYLRDRRRRSDVDLDRRRPAAGSFRARCPRGSNELEPVVCRNESRHLRDVRSRPQWRSLRLNMPATAIYDMQSPSRTTTSSWLRTAAACGFSTTCARSRRSPPRRRHR